MYLNFIHLYHWNIHIFLLFNGIKNNIYRGNDGFVYMYMYYYIM
jgi:hypothetical protein